MSLQRQPFFSQLFKDPDRRSPNWANKAAVFRPGEPRSHISSSHHGYYVFFFFFLWENFLKVFGSGRSDEHAGNSMTMFKW